MNRQTEYMLQLTEAVTQLAGWHYANDGQTAEMELYWAQRVHHLSTMVLAGAQDQNEDHGPV